MNAATAELREVTETYARGLQPDPQLTVTEWADTHRRLSTRETPEPGQWSTDRVPYLREIMDALSARSPYQHVVFMKGAQLGGTEAGNNWIGYAIHHQPGPMLFVQPTLVMAQRASRQRVDPMIRACAALRARVLTTGRRTSGNTVLVKQFPGGTLVLTGANSAVGLRSMPAGKVFLDEVDGYPYSLQEEGDPIVLAQRAARNFGDRRKLFYVSTPKVAGLSRIHRLYEASDQRMYHVPCPLCGTLQVLSFGRLRWPDDWREHQDPDAVTYECATCEGQIAEHHKTWMLAAANGARWIATARSKDPKTVGFHLSALYSPHGWLSWAGCVALHLDAEDHPTIRPVFRNTIEGLPHADSADAPDWRALYNRRSTAYAQGEVPRGVLFLSIGADVQKNRIEAEVVGWGRDGESWSIAYEKLEGDTAQPAVWRQLDELLATEWPCQGTDQSMRARLIAVDAGYATQIVYAWVKPKPQAQYGPGGGRAPVVGTALAIMGTDRESVALTWASRKKKGDVPLWFVNENQAKTELYSWLRLEYPTPDEIAAGVRVPRGYCHYPEYEPEWFKQLTSHRRIIKVRHGFPKPGWTKDPGQADEALDCRKYARAAAEIFGLSRFSEREWKQLERMTPWGDLETPTRPRPMPSPDPEKNIGVPPKVPGRPTRPPSKRVPWHQR
jgi:phage terminase large subunit GpA-like protein